MARGRWKRIVRAVLASGSESDLREFGEVWRGETRGRKVKKDEWDVLRAKKVDLENDEWGEFGMKGDEDELDEAEDEVMTDAPSTSRNQESEYGGPDAMKLRHRLLIQVRSPPSTIIGFTNPKLQAPPATQPLQRSPCPLHLHRRSLRHLHRVSQAPPAPLLSGLLRRPRTSRCTLPA